MRSKREPMVSFDRSSPVRAYWLAHCEGFRLQTPWGREGIVEAVLFESPERPRYVAVRMGFARRRRLIPVEWVEEVFPAQQLLVLSQRPTRTRRAAARAGAHARRLGRSAPPAAARAAVVVGRVLAAGLLQVLLFLAALALAVARGAHQTARTGGAVLARLAPIVRRAALATAWTLRLGAVRGAAAIRRGAARTTVALREGGRRGHSGAVRFRTAAAPRARAGATQAVGAVRNVNGRLEGPLLRLHRRLAPEQDAITSPQAHEPLLPRSFRPPARSARRPGSPTRSTSRRSS